MGNNQICIMGLIFPVIDTISAHLLYCYRWRWGRRRDRQAVPKVETEGGVKREGRGAGLRRRVLEVMRYTKANILIF